MGNRVYLTFVSVIAGLLIFVGIGLPARSYLSYREALKADFEVQVKAKVLSFSLVDPDEGVTLDASEKRFYAPVLHFEYMAPDEDTLRQGQLMIPYSRYWSTQSEEAKKLGEEFQPIGGSLDIYLSQKDPGKYALRPSEAPAKNYVILTPIGIIFLFFALSLLVHRARTKKIWSQADLPKNLILSKSMSVPTRTKEPALERH